MKVFLSYPSQERPVAERLNLALLALGHDVFFDRADLPAGLEYNQAIAQAIDSADLFIFFITPDSVASGRYTLTELGLAERRWQHPDGRLLPVMISPTDRSLIPSYARAVSIFTPRGDVVAETAQEAQRLLASRRLTTRVVRWLRSGTGMVTLGVGAVAAIIAVLTRPWESTLRGGGAPTLPADVRQRAREVVPMADSGFVVATSAPPRLIRYTENGAQLGEPVDLMGEPVSLTRTPSQILAVTRTPDGVMVIDAKRFNVTDSVLLDPSTIKPPNDVKNPSKWSGDIHFAVVGRYGLWVTTGDRDGEPSVLRYRGPEGRWDVVSWMLDTAGFGPDAKGVRLRLVGDQLWGTSTNGVPSRLYHLVDPFVRIDRFDGRTLPLVRCATDVVASSKKNPIVVSCDNELQELESIGNSIRLVGARPTLPKDAPPARMTSNVLATHGLSVIVALNSEAGADARPVRARIAEVDSTGAVTPLLDERDAAVRSLAVTPRSVVAVLRRADGSADVRVVRRRPSTQR